MDICKKPIVGSLLILGTKGAMFLKPWPRRFIDCSYFDGERTLNRLFRRPSAKYSSGAEIVKSSVRDPNYAVGQRSRFF